MQVKKPGLEMATIQSELDLSYGLRYQGVTIPEAYERLILDTYALISQVICQFVLYLDKYILPPCHVNVLGLLFELIGLFLRSDLLSIFIYFLLFCPYLTAYINNITTSNQ